MITPIYTVVLTTLFLFLSFNVIKLRHRYQVSLGDSGQPKPHAFGLSRENNVNKYRIIGMQLTLLTMVLSMIGIIYISIV